MYHDLLQYDLRIGDHNAMSLAMKNHFHPFSITEDEFNFIRKHIASKHYKSGYELATAFGLSSCAIGLGLKASGGKLISVDAYIEEQVNLAWGYPTDHKQTFEDSDGYKTALKLRKHFSLEDTVEFHVGWSPDDIPKILGDRKLDFAFIDAAHFDENLLADVSVIKDLLIPPFTVMIHDTHSFNAATFSTIADWLGTNLVKPHIPRSFNLGYFERNR